MGAIGLHKQIANRHLEAEMFITVIVTATEWDNWFKLRCHPDAQPEIGWVAKEMKRQYDEAIPRVLSLANDTFPLIDWDDEVGAVTIGLPSGTRVDNYDLQKVSAGRCARVPYLTHDGKRDMDEDVKLADKLMSSGHWSPSSTWPRHYLPALPMTYIRTNVAARSTSGPATYVVGPNIGKQWTPHLLELADEY